MMHDILRPRPRARARENTGRLQAIRAHVQEFRDNDGPVWVLAWLVLICALAGLVWLAETVGAR